MLACARKQANRPGHVEAVGDCSAPGVSNKVLAHDDHNNASGADVLLRARIYEPVLGHVHGLGAEVRRHVSDKRCTAHIRGALEFHALDGLIVTVVHICGARREIPCVARRHRFVVALGHNVDDGILARLLCRLLAP